jgi:DNA topoisomerase-1
MYLLITESPAKAKKIQGFLSNQYKVKSSCGHIVDLEKKKLSIDVDNDFKPTYKVTHDKKDVVKMLKENAKGCHVIFAADDDREGEAIAWHTANVLKTDITKNNRIIFREISKKAILKALETPIKINMDEVNAQQARRIIDRLIGFKLSPCLWKHIKSSESGLSAGRVQSALLNLVEGRENYINDYEPEYNLDINGSFDGLEETEFIFTEDVEIDDDLIKDLFKKFSIDRKFNVYDSSLKKEKSYPKKPFITSTLQQAAQNELGFPVKMTMDTAQRLYEGGHITYMRTDSTFISEDFQKTLNDHIENKYGKDFYQKSKEKKVKGAQEAHEAIRPTNLDTIPDVEEVQMKLYNFIKKRTITSHMKPAEYDVFRIKMKNDLLLKEDIGYFTAKNKVLTFPGYLLYGKNKDEFLKDDFTDNDFKKEYLLKSCLSSGKDGLKPQHYNESGIVKLLEETGIGRPSTYATIISTLDNRKYTVKENIVMGDREEDRIVLNEDDTIEESTEVIKGSVSKQRILITPLGKKVLKYLQEHFANILDKTFTTMVEQDLDLVAKGEADYIEIIRKVYSSFIDSVDRQMNLKVERVDLRLLGEKSSKKIYLGVGKYGPYLQLVNKDEKKKNSSIQKYLELIKKDEKDVCLEDAVQFLKYPKNINEDILIHIGPYGYYMKCKGRNYKINQSGDYTEEYCSGILRK